jgi:hypothetical protein
MLPEVHRLYHVLLRVFETRVLRMISELTTEELPGGNCILMSFLILLFPEYYKDKIRVAGPGARNERMRSAYRILLTKPGRPRHRGRITLK